MSLPQNFIVTPRFQHSAEDILKLLIPHLVFQDFLVCSMVCRRWAYLCNDPNSWRKVYEVYENRLKGSNEKNINIWESTKSETFYKENITQDEEGNIKWATLNGIVERLTPANRIPDRLEEMALLNTYKSFTTPQLLVRKLFERYFIPDKTIEHSSAEWKKEVMKPIQIRVCHIIKKLLELDYKHFSRDLITLCKIFSKMIEPNLAATIKFTIGKEERKLRGGPASPRQSEPHRSLPIPQLSIPEKKKKRRNSAEKKFRGILPRSKDKLISNFFSAPPKSFVKECPSLEIARHLSMITFETYKQIEPSELIGQQWTKEAKDTMSPHIRKMIDHFNFVTGAIATSVLLEDRIKARVKIITKWIKIAQCLEKMNNFHSLMAVLSGLNEGCIHRLKQTQTEIPEKYQMLYQELQTLMSYDGSYKNYRKRLNEAHLPCIPYLGIYLRDLTYLESTDSKGANDLVEKGVNFKQKKQVVGVINFLQNYQSTPYLFKKHDDIISQLTTSLTVLSSSELLKLSYKYEASASARKLKVTTKLHEDTGDAKNS